MKDIKTRKVSHDIKTSNREEHLKYYARNRRITIKLYNLRYSNRNKKDEDSSNAAVNDIVNSKKRAAIRMRSVKRNDSIKRKIYKYKNNIKNAASSRININTEYKSQYASDTQTSKHTLLLNDNRYIYDKKASDDFHESIKRHKIFKQIKANPNVKMREHSLFSIHLRTNMIKKAMVAIKMISIGVNHIIAAGVGFILLIVVILFIVVFSALSTDSNFYDPSLYVSEEVLAYTEIIEKYAQEYDIGEYVNLIQAVMMQESEGKGTDPMKSSECYLNELYPRVPNGITDAEYSIQIGIHYLAECIKLADVKDQSDMENISLALQGYNYGIEYIQWAQNHFGGYTRANAKVYSDEKKIELQIDTYGDAKYVSHVTRYYHIGNGNIVLIAKSQVGNVGGEKYWSWYGFDERVEWCAIFVSWCGNESGQLNRTIPRFSLVSDGVNWYKEKGLWKDKTYIPKAGDIIFFDWEQDGSPDHVGIVEKTEGNYIYTIEGNSSDECKQNCYSIDSFIIFGYSNIN